MSSGGSLSQAQIPSSCVSERSSNSVSGNNKKVPIGSGAVESAVRRIVNMRMKGNARFWLEENGEGMLLMRSYLKAGRIDDLSKWVHARSVNWWDEELTNTRGPISDVVPTC